MRRKIVKLLLLTPLIYVLILFLTSTPVDYTLQPNQSVTIPVRTKHRHIEYYALLHFEKYDECELKLSSPGDAWYDKDNEVYYDLESQSIIVRKTEEKGWFTENEKELNGISLADDGIVLDFTGERVFDITTSYDYAITVTNVSSHPISFTAIVAHH